MITRVRPDSYYYHIIPRLEKMGEEMTLEAARRGFRVADGLVRRQIAEITASPSCTPEQDMKRWCDDVITGIEEMTAPTRRTWAEDNGFAWED